MEIMKTLTAIIQKNVIEALQEDLGVDDPLLHQDPASISQYLHHDLTAQLVPEDEDAKAIIISREPAVICGIPWVDYVFKRLAPEAKIEWHVREGDAVASHTTLCQITGKARPLLIAERTALNFLQTLSGTATQTRTYVEAIAGFPARIMDTRKTLPQLRDAQKYAVAIGGGLNQRQGLYDGILIKENHIAAAGSIERVLENAEKIGKECTIQIEVESLNQLESALNAGAKLILLDNFDLETMKQAVQINQKRAQLEASGGIDLHNVREIAATGVDRISIGSITKHLHAIDLSMRFI